MKKRSASPHDRRAVLERYLIGALPHTEAERVEARLLWCAETRCILEALDAELTALDPLLRQGLAIFAEEWLDV